MISAYLTCIFSLSPSFSHTAYSTLYQLYYYSITTPLSSHILPSSPFFSLLLPSLYLKSSINRLLLYSTQLSLTFHPSYPPYNPPITPHRALAEGELLATNLTRKEVHDLQKWYRVERVRRHRERRRR
jgi:hypothetical protein